MNLGKIFTKKEIDLLFDAGIKIEDRNYTKEEIKVIDNKTMDFVMSKSTKNNEIGKTLNLYDSTFCKLIKYGM